MKHRASDFSAVPAVDPRVMFLPLQSTLMLQVAMLRAWEPWLRCATHLQQQACLCHKEFLAPRPHLRHGDVCSKAADLKDHYGRRTGDVEVERI